MSESTQAQAGGCCGGGCCGGMQEQPEQQQAAEQQAAEQRRETKAPAATGVHLEPGAAVPSATPAAHAGPEHVEEPVAYDGILLSDWFPATTGELIHVDGGFHAMGV